MPTTPSSLHVPKTGAALTHMHLHVQKPSDGLFVQQTFHSTWDPQLLKTAEESQSQWYVTQELVHFALSDIKLGRKVDQNRDGQVWTCHLFSQGYMIKYPPSVTLEQSYGSRKRPLDSDRLYLYEELYAREMQNFARLTEPHEYVEESRGRGFMPFQSSNREQNQRQYISMEYEMQDLKRHPGFKHMHKLIHFEVKDQIPFVLSERYHGSLMSLLEAYQGSMHRDFKPKVLQVQGQEVYEPSRLWKKLAKQLSSAQAFMLNLHMVSVKINPSNVLYVLGAQGLKSIRFMVSDYSLCMGSEDFLPHGFTAGKYDPPLQLRTKLNAGEVAIYQLFTTLISAIDLHVHPEQEAFFLLPSVMEAESTVATCLHSTTKWKPEVRRILKGVDRTRIPGVCFEILEEGTCYEPAHPSIETFFRSFEEICDEFPE